MEQNKIWDFYQNHVSHDRAFNAEGRYTYIANHLKNGEHVLNIGVGQGGLENLMLLKGIVTYSLDPNEKTIEMIKERLKLGDKAKSGLSQAIPFNSEKFDAVIMSEVLEHLPDEVISETLIEVKRVLNKNGRFIVTVPAGEQLSNNEVICPECGNFFHRWGHVQSFDESKLRTLISSQFNVKKLTRYHFYNPNGLNWKGKIGARFKQITLKIGFKGRNENFFCVAHK